MYESTEKRIVVRLPGVKLLSTRGSGANGSEDRWTKARSKETHRTGANANVAKSLGGLPGRWCFVMQRKKKPKDYWTVSGREGPFVASRITFTRICPKRFFCDPGGNLATLFKATEDGVADALGVDDKTFAITPPGAEVQSGTVGVWYEQIDGPWGLRITIESA
jgi:hypothetical protein